MSDPLPLSPQELAMFREGVAGILPMDGPYAPRTAVEAERMEWANRVRRLLATLDREQEARTLARAEVIAEATEAVLEATGYWFRTMGYPDQRFLKDTDVLAALSRLGERE